MTTPYEEGDPQSKIAVIGEAPSYTEIRMNRPLVGPSGKLFDQLLHNAGVARRECYLTNVWEFQVEKRGNNVYRRDTDERLYSPRGFTPEGLEYARPALQRLQRTEANVIVPLGGTALDLINGQRAITKWRGSILRPTADEITDRKSVPTVHPAAILRGQYLLRYPVVSDLRRAKEESRDRTLNLPDRTYWLRPQRGQVLEYLRAVHQSRKTAFDIEIYNQQISCISFALSATECMSIPFVDEGQPYWSLEDEMEIWSAISDITSDPEVLNINQNIIFDIWFLAKQMGIRTRGPIGDTMVAHHIIYPDFPKGLDFICSVQTREPYYKDDGKIWKKINVDWEQYWLYNAKDSAVAYEIWDALEPELHEKGHWETYQNTVALFDPLLYMMLRGIKIDQDGLARTKQRVEAELEERENALKDCAEWEFNPSSPKQCQEYFYVTKHIKPYTSRKTGRITTDDKALARIIRRYNLPEARLAQEIRNLRKLIGTYLDISFDTDGRLRCSYNPRGTTTGRLSSSKTILGTGMNQQNLDPRFRTFLVADD